MPTMILNLDEKENNIVKDLAHKWGLNSKEKTIKLMIQHFKNGGKLK